MSLSVLPFCDALQTPSKLYKNEDLFLSVVVNSISKMASEYLFS